MFAPRVPKAQMKMPASLSNGLVRQHSPLVAHRPSRDAVGLTRVLQSTIGNQAATRLLAQWPQSVKGNEYRVQEAEGLAREVPVASSWNFSKTNVFPPDRAGQSKVAVVPVSQPGDPLELHADGVAARLLAGMDPAGSGGSAGTGRGPAVDVPQNREESGQLDAAGNGDRQGANASAALRSLPQSDGTLANQLAGRYGKGQTLGS